MAAEVPECKRTGKYKVTWKWPNASGGKNAYLDLPNTHGDSIKLSLAKPYTGPLCKHELEFLESTPGREFSEQWSFTVSKVS